MASSFSLDVSKWVEKAKGRADDVVRRVALELHTQIVMKSPVGNPSLWKHPVKGYVGGRFRNNWFPGVGTRSNSTTEQRDASGEGSINRMQLLLPGIHAGDVIFTTNNLPYSMRLETGWSTQAPVGMVRVTVENYPGIVQQAVAEAKGAKP
jgi:hypothetical protein